MAVYIDKYGHKWPFTGGVNAALPLTPPLDAPASGMKAKICNAPINIECRTTNVEVLSMAGWDVCVNKATNSSLFTRVNTSTFLVRYSILIVFFKVTK